MRVRLELAWRIDLGGVEHEIEPLVFALLDGVERGGNLNYAAGAAGVSYRHAWGLMRTWEQRLHQPLLVLQRGRGAALSTTGRALIDARTHAAQAALAGLEEAANLATEQLRPALAGQHLTIRIASSHNDLLNGLVDALGERDCTSVLEVTGSEGALRRYQRGEIDVAGFHLPLGELGRTVGLALTGLLDDLRDRVFLLELRVLGLMSSRAKPITSVDALSAPGVRFINRQAGSGTRLVFDGLLGVRGIAPGLIDGYRNEEYTHSAVAATVASGNADAGFGTATAADRFDLAFTPLVQERFYLCVRRSAPRELQDVVAQYARNALALGERAPAGGEIEPTVALLRRLHASL